MSILVAGLVIFLGVHAVSIVAPGWRDAQVARHGAGAWKAAYSIVSAIGLALVVVGYGMARREPAVLYAPPAGLRHVALLVMVPVFPLLFAAYLPGRIRSAAKNPMLIAVCMWAAAHLLANGTVADVLLFGGFGVWAVADLLSMTRRPPSKVPGAPPGPANDAVAVIGGLAVYAAFVFGLHRWLTGVSPLA